MILGPESQVLGPWCWGPEFWVLGSSVLGPRSQTPGLGSQVFILDYAKVN